MQNHIQCQITLKEPVENVSKLLDSLARIVRVSANEFHVRENDSQELHQLTLEMPEKVFERLLRIGQAGGEEFQSLGIVRMKEILTEFHNLDNIRLMLTKMFSAQTFRDFCQKHFPAVRDSFAPDSNKKAMVEALLRHARRTSRIPHVLVFARQHNQKIYEKYEPYYETPRIAPSPKNQVRSTRPAPRPFIINLTVKEFIQASSMGVGVAAGLTFLLQRIMMLPFPESLSVITYFLWGFVALLGILVGEAVSKGAPSKRGQFLAIISACCYWLGFILGTALAYISVSGGIFQFTLILRALFIGVISAISTLLSLSSPTIGMIIGTIFAYKYAR